MAVDTACRTNQSSGAKGGGQEIKELPGGSPSIHISVGAREKGTEERRERKEKRSASRVCSWQLFQQPVSVFWLLFSFLRYLFDESIHIFNFNVRYNCCKRKHYY